jgi:diguanylate cyclase (GGDEF)-like protein/PAS domain S-box-containing protein
MQDSGPERAGDRTGGAHERALADELTLRRKETARADAIRKAVTTSAAELLRSLAPDQSIPTVLEQIGRASGVSRIQLYLNEQRAKGRIVSALWLEWDAPGIASAADVYKRKGRHAAIWDRDQLVPFQAQGQALSVLTRNAEEPLRSLLSLTGIKSVLLMPVFVDGEWWGELGFDDCEQERIWSSIEIDTLKTLAELVGASIARARDLSALSDASRIIENSPVVLYRIGPQAPHPLTYVSRNVSHYGYDASEFLASPTRYLDLFHPDDLPDVMLDIERITDGKASGASRERRVRVADGRYIWVEDRTRAIYDDKHALTAIEGILIDIDERKAAEAEIARYALADPVTGLANRKAFMNELSRAFTSARRGAPAFAIHYIDLDRFKDVNDVLGHSKGDELLKAVAERLIGLSRTSGDLVARFGGDEFAVLQTAVSDPSDAGAFAARILRELAEPYGLGTELHITASIGISVYSREVSGPEEMIKQADVALYRAKELGRNQFHFHSEELDVTTIERVMLGGDLRHALDRGELEIYYQPQVEIDTGRIVGLEGLARWHHPTRGLLCPTRFIPIAEKNGTIQPLGRWVIDNVCRQIAAWRGQGLSPPTIAINVSAEQFKSTPEFDQELSQKLQHWGVEPSDIELELTESVLMETTRQHGKIIDRLRALGVAIAIDDFGTGYSSLGYLRAYHVNRIKIAQEFVRDLQEDTGDVAIVRAAIGLGRELGIAVIAEGVETKLQLDILAAAGCRYVQGFYFSRPVTAKKAAELLRQGHLAAGQDTTLPRATR